MKLKLHFLKHITFKFFLSSLIIAGMITYLMWKNFNPYKLTVLESTSNTDVYKTYHDFDKDGFSECLVISVFPESDRYFIQIINRSGGIIDQTN